MLLDPATTDRGASSPTRRTSRLRVAESRPGLDLHQRRPTPRRLQVSRPQFADRLAAAQTATLALVVAPAGYGKTTVLAEWAEHDERPFAWIAAVPGDNDPDRLLASIVRALHEIEALPQDVVRWAAAPRVERGTGVLGGLLAALDAGRRPAVLVVDDAHVLREPAAVELMSTLIDHVTAPSMVVIASRTEPALPVGRLRAQDALVELRTGDLAMSDAEAGQVLSQAGLELAPADAAAIVHSTEGWPAGLHLAGLAVADQEDPARAVGRFAGDDRVVADYLRDEMLAPLTAGELEFLTRTSLLDRLSGPLCDAVLGRQGSGDALWRLARGGVLLTPIDRGEEVFRLHGLLADLLRSRLRRTEAALEVTLHERASAFYEREGDVDRAIEHAIAAGEVDRVADLLWTVMPAHMAQNRDRLLERWLERLDDAQIAERPVLALAAATSCAARGARDVAERWTATAERAILREPAERRRPLSAVALALRAMIARDGVAHMGQDAAQALALAGTDSPWRSVACFLEGVSLHLGGELGAARIRLEEGARRGTPAVPSLRVLCLAQLALMALQDDDLEEGSVLIERARGDVDYARLSDTPACALVFAVSAYALAYHGRVDAARRDATTARRLIGDFDEVTPWYDAEVRVALARAELRLSDASAARSLLSDASRALRRVPDTLLVHGWIDDAWARADTFAVGAVAGPSTLTRAELRVLRFLPSHLSFREIATRLHVSANTVKTQAHAVYRKLDASSRSEAVARARDVGLIDS
jgi:LuxR family maltose regulon positive regulatory protein